MDGKINFLSLSVLIVSLLGAAKSFSLCRNNNYNKYDPLCHAYCPTAINIYNDAIVYNLRSASYNEAKGYVVEGFGLACRTTANDNKIASFVARPNAAAVYPLNNQICHKIKNWIDQKISSKKLASFSFTTDKIDPSKILGFEEIGLDGAVSDGAFPSFSDKSCIFSKPLVQNKISSDYF